MLGTTEFEELMKMFEKDFRHLRLDREPRELWRKRIYYQDGRTNDAFQAYSCGYSYGRCV